MRYFTRKGYGRIYVKNPSDIPMIHEIIKDIDEFEYDYLPEGFIAPLKEYPRLVPTQKFDGIDLDHLTIYCAINDIQIICLDNGHQETIYHPIKWPDEIIPEHSVKQELLSTEVPEEYETPSPSDSIFS